MSTLATIIRVTGVIAFIPPALFWSLKWDSLIIRDGQRFSDTKSERETSMRNKYSVSSWHVIKAVNQKEKRSLR